jgi:hypothetical protein
MRILKKHVWNTLYLDPGILKNYKADRKNLFSNSSRIQSYKFRLIRIAKFYQLIEWNKMI